MLERNAHTTPCWVDAIEQLVKSCRQIEADDISKSRFAVHLTNWFVIYICLYVVVSFIYFLSVI